MASKILSATEPTDLIPVKWSHFGAMRRFIIAKSDWNFKKLRAILVEMEPSFNHALSYKDSDGDNIIFSTSAEMLELLENFLWLSKKNNSKLLIRIESVDDFINKANVEKRLHPNIICDECECEVRGTRFKCVICDDFDLCERCERRDGAHTKHAMLRLATPETPKCFELFLGAGTASRRSRGSRHFHRGNSDLRAAIQASMSKIHPPKKPARQHQQTDQRKEQNENGPESWLMGHPILRKLPELDSQANETAQRSCQFVRSLARHLADGMTFGDEEKNQSKPMDVDTDLNGETNPSTEQIACPICATPHIATDTFCQCCSLRFDVLSNQNANDLAEKDKDKAEHKVSAKRKSTTSESVGAAKASKSSEAEVPSTEIQQIQNRFEKMSCSQTREENQVNRQEHQARLAEQVHRDQQEQKQLQQAQEEAQKIVEGLVNGMHDQKQAQSWTQTQVKSQSQRQGPQSNAGPHTQSNGISSISRGAADSILNQLAQRFPELSGILTSEPVRTFAQDIYTIGDSLNENVITPFMEDLMGIKGTFAAESPVKKSQKTQDSQSQSNVQKDKTTEAEKTQISSQMKDSNVKKDQELLKDDQKTDQATGNQSKSLKDKKKKKELHTKMRQFIQMNENIQEQNTAKTGRCVHLKMYDPYMNAMSGFMANGNNSNYCYPSYFRQQQNCPIQQNASKTMSEQKQAQFGKPADEMTEEEQRKQKEKGKNVSEMMFRHKTLYNHVNSILEEGMKVSAKILELKDEREDQLERENADKEQLGRQDEQTTKNNQMEKAQGSGQKTKIPAIQAKTLSRLEFDYQYLYNLYKKYMQDYHDLSGQLIEMGCYEILQGQKWPVIFPIAGHENMSQMPMPQPSTNQPVQSQLQNQNLEEVLKLAIAEDDKMHKFFNNILKVESASEKLAQTKNEENMNNLNLNSNKLDSSSISFNHDEDRSKSGRNGSSDSDKSGSGLRPEDDSELYKDEFGSETSSGADSCEDSFMEMEMDPKMPSRHLPDQIEDHNAEKNLGEKIADGLCTVRALTPQLEESGDILAEIESKSVNQAEDDSTVQDSMERGSNSSFDGEFVHLNDANEPAAPPPTGTVSPQAQVESETNETQMNESPNSYLSASDSKLASGLLNSPDDYKLIYSEADQEWVFVKKSNYKNLCQIFEKRRSTEFDIEDEVQEVLEEKVAQAANLSNNSSEKSEELSGLLVNIINSLKNFPIQEPEKSTNTTDNAANETSQNNRLYPQLQETQLESRQQIQPTVAAQQTQSMTKMDDGQRSGPTPNGYQVNELPLKVSTKKHCYAGMPFYHAVPRPHVKKCPIRHESVVVQATVDKLEDMGYDNCNGWLTGLSERFNGDISLILDEAEKDSLYQARLAADN